MQFVAKTDIGLVRKRNEDYFVVSHDHGLVVLCDGMGGHPGGDIASRMAAEEVQKTVEGGGDPKQVPLDVEDSEELQPFLTLLRGIFAADICLRDYGKENPQYQGMGTTLIALQATKGRLCVAHVGDSRVYALRGSQFEQVTRDHSVAATHPEYAHLAGMRNILTRAMGVGDDLEVDFVVGPAQPGVLYLLCTDGLHNFVPEDRIVEILRSQSAIDVRAQALIEAAKSGGGGDNVTLALALVGNEGAPSGKAMRGMIRQTNRQLQVVLEPEA